MTAALKTCASGEKLRQYIFGNASKCSKNSNHASNIKATHNRRKMKQTHAWFPWGNAFTLVCYGNRQKSLLFSCRISVKPAILIHKNNEKRFILLDSMEVNVRRSELQLFGIGIDICCLFSLPPLVRLYVCFRDFGHNCLINLSFFMHISSENGYYMFCAPPQWTPLIRSICE